MNDPSVLWEEIVHGGATWSHVVKRGTALRIVDLEGNANVGAIFYNFECPAERFNMPDTLKAQHIARLTKEFVLYSDMGRILCSITEDTAGWHDPLGGCSNAALVVEKYGAASYQDSRNDYYKNARDGFLAELAKWGLDPPDLAANVNFFSRVNVAEDGSMTHQADHSEPGAFVELRAEMNVLTILNTCQHPLDTNPKYAPKPIKVSIRRAAAPGPDDPCRLSRPENARGFILTQRYFL